MLSDEMLSCNMLIFRVFCDFVPAKIRHSVPEQHQRIRRFMEVDPLSPLSVCVFQRDDNGASGDVYVPGYS